MPARSWIADGSVGVLLVYQEEGDAEAQRRAAESAGGLTTVDVAEIEGAYYTPDTGTVGAQAGDAFVQVSWLPPGGTANQEESVALTQEALANL